MTNLNFRKHFKEEFEGIVFRTIFFFLFFCGFRVGWGGLLIVICWGRRCRRKCTWGWSRSWVRGEEAEEEGEEESEENSGDEDGKERHQRISMEIYTNLVIDTHSPCRLEEQISHSSPSTQLWDEWCRRSTSAKVPLLRNGESKEHNNNQ